MAKIINGSSLALALANYLCTNAYLNDTAEDVLIMVGNWIDEAPEITVPKWIPVSERLPDDFISVIIYIPSESPLPMVKEAYHAEGCWAAKMQIFFDEEVTHWMPLPEPPKED